jgi:hypothetical protein
MARRITNAQRLARNAILTDGLNLLPPDRFARVERRLLDFVWEEAQAAMAEIEQNVARGSAANKGTGGAS